MVFVRQCVGAIRHDYVSIIMKEIAKALQKNRQIFSNDRQATIYLALLQNGPLGVEKLAQTTGLHRETLQREIKKMEKLFSVRILQTGRNKKIEASPISALQQILDESTNNFEKLLKPLLETQSDKNQPKIEVYMNDHKFALLQIKLMKLQPEKNDSYVISARPQKWINAMINSRKLEQFEKIRLQKRVGILLSAFSEYKGQVEYNNRNYFTSQPKNLKRHYRYVKTNESSPIQIQIWFQAIVISIFDSTPSIHIVIEDKRIVKAMRSYFKILWGIGEK